ncbi:hypothetical protein MMC32_000720 [Xylographa parallela]|nr:hypothetical protein [Xylographa parallela]
MSPVSEPGPNLGGSPGKTNIGEEWTPLQAASTQVRLTFGIELEFFYTYDDSYESELVELGSRYGIQLTPEKSYQLVYEIVAQILRKNKLPVNAVTEDRSKDSYDKWTVKTEYLDPNPVHDPNTKWHEIEVVSRVLVFEEKSFEEVRLVLAILEKFPGPYKFYVNRCAGSHVHVGAEQEKFVLPWLKKFTQTVTAFEHEIESLHSDDRIQNRFARAPSQLHRLLARNGPLASLGVLDAQKTFEDLYETFAENRYNAYNLDNLLDPDSYPSDETRPKQTIEFRQHAGTLDGDTICNWVEFVCALIKYSFSADHRENLVYLMNHLKDFPDTAYSIEDLMKKVGVPHLFAWYRDNNRISDRGRVPVSKLPKIDPSCEYPDLQPLWELLQSNGSSIEIVFGLRKLTRGREDEEEHQEAPFQKMRRLQK